MTNNKGHSLLQIAGDEYGLLSADLGRGAGDLHDVGHVVDRGLAEVGEAVAARIMFFFHQKVNGAVLREQSDGLAVPETLLAAVAVFAAVLADLEVARQIDDLADDVTTLPATVSID